MDRVRHERVLAPQRQELIVSEVRRRGSVRVRELTDLLGVSEMTIRRDLDTLAEAGLLEKVHGGATILGAARLARSSEEPGFAAKSARQQAEKRAIAARAAALVRPGCSVGVSAGTTTWHLAHHLVAVPDLVVVTNSLRIVETLHAARRSDLEIVLTGGTPTPSDAMVGPVAERALEGLHLDLVFLGVHGMSERAGFTTPNLLEARTDEAFIAAGARVVVTADSTKWGTVGLAAIAPLEAADAVITDDGLPSEARAALDEAVDEVIVVPVDAGSGPAAD